MSELQTKKKTRLETIADVCIIVACVLVSVTLVQRWTSTNSTAARPSSYQAGEIIEPLSGVSFGAKPRTVLLYVASTCQFCTASMPLYAELSSHRNTADFQIIVVGREPTTVLSSYASEHGVQADKVMQVSAGSRRLTATPTLLVLDHTGKIEGSWVGLLGERVKEVRDALGIPASDN